METKDLKWNIDFEDEKYEIASNIVPIDDSEKKETQEVHSPVSKNKNRDVLSYEYWNDLFNI